MSDRIWTVEEANRALPRVTAVVERAREALASMRADRRDLAGAASGNGHGRPADAGPVLAAIDELGAEGIVVRDVEQGLVDFPAESPSGRRYWLCWLVGEPEVAWWHYPEDGFAGRTPLSSPPP